jgi:hypothetical protein
VTSQHPTPPLATITGPALVATSGQPLTGRRWMPFDTWVRAARQSADCLSADTHAAARASTNGDGPGFARARTGR